MGELVSDEGNPYGEERDDEEDRVAQDLGVGEDQSQGYHRDHNVLDFLRGEAHVLTYFDNVIGIL